MQKTIGAKTYRCKNSSYFDQCKDSTLLGYPYGEKRKDSLFYQMFQVETKTSLRSVNSQVVEVYLILSLSYTLKKSINEKVLNTFNISLCYNRNISQIQDYLSSVGRLIELY